MKREGLAGNIGWRVGRLIDWSDAASGISVNPSEERLLSTSFITSLLAQTSEPLYASTEKPPSAWRGQSRSTGKGETLQQNSRDGQSKVGSSIRTYEEQEKEKEAKRRPYQSIPVSIRSNPSEHYLMGTVEEEPIPRHKLSPIRDDPASALPVDELRAANKACDVACSGSTGDSWLVFL